MEDMRWQEREEGMFRRDKLLGVMTWQNSLVTIYFSFLFWTYYTRKECGKIAHDYNIT